LGGTWPNLVKSGATLDNSMVFFAWRGSMVCGEARAYRTCGTWRGARRQKRVAAALMAAAAHAACPAEWMAREDFFWLPL
jgi:hypothetical protein